MKKDYSTTFSVNAPAKKVFACVNDVTAWWTENLEGKSQKLNDEFTVRFGDVHVSTQKLIEVVPDKKVVWLITDSRLNFISDKQEWTNTKISFDIAAEGGKTQLRFTHHGLVPGIECFEACSNAWSEYVESLKLLITDGKGQPAKKERARAKAAN
ncbi:MAG TPA: SRPBCC domain-containing protein [Chryseosolibacter sp.]